MYIGQLIMSNQTGYSPWFEREAAGLKIPVEYLAGGGTDDLSVNLTVSLDTKDHDEEGDGTAVTGSSASTTISSGFGTITVAPTATGTGALKELVRFKIEAAASVENELNWVNYRILTPTWYERGG